ncbi:histidinol-phosphate transaminase [Clostridiaceae bacterium UIB06]|uniref:Histidinol-phosphate aminotransferase n=1 Tax=Clostridium thailandense TaxID=2794346 RepID=A0A949THP6_9CLOT|nr:histidinol-phosphate transaminase [Clostridium thailandense]MBV7272445.1 histidinol-phosphate transaminase [Clostridium thailandense]MCH5136969.1 histidinol-phosphate transaminase [Clostridiaceae bacterium UIB06]
MPSKFPPLKELVPAYINKIEPYIPSKPDDILKQMYNCSFLYRMNNNENVLGPPPKALEAIRSFLPERAAIYPSGDAYHLRQRLGEIYGLSPDSFIVGNGANEVIAFVIKAFCQQGDNIITADKTFAVYEWVADFSGFESRLVPLKDYGFDDEAMLAAVDKRTKIIFVCNPNNPTGSYWNEEKLRAFLDRVNGRQIVVVDEAYAEFAEAEDFPNAMQLIDEYPNLVVFRTFSKMYALAALRIGYLAGNLDIVDVIRRTCIVYSVNVLAQEAAIAALEDDGGHIKRTKALIKESKEYLKKELESMGLHYVSGEGNYIMIRLPFSDTLAYRKLMNLGYMVRTMTGFRYPNYIRVTLNSLSVMEGFVRALRKII